MSWPDLPDCVTLMRAQSGLTIRDTPSALGRNMGRIPAGMVVRVDRGDYCLLYGTNYRYIRLVSWNTTPAEEPLYIVWQEVTETGVTDWLTLHRDDCDDAPEIPDFPEVPEREMSELAEYQAKIVNAALPMAHDKLGTEKLLALLSPETLKAMQELTRGTSTPDVPDEEEQPDTVPGIPPVETFPPETEPPVVTPPPVEEPEPTSQLTPFSTSGNKVLFNGKEFRAIGFNLREAIGYGDIMQWATPALLRRQLQIVKEIGGKTVRFYAAHLNLSATEAAIRTEKFLNLLQEFDLFGIVVLDDGAQSEFRIRKSEKNYKGRLTHEFYGGGFRDEYVPYITEVLKRVGNHPNVFCFELMNEPVTPHPPDPTIPQMEAMLNWMGEAVKVRRQYAPHKLDSNGFISSWEMGSVNAYDGFKFAQKAHKITQLASLHTYQGQRNLPYGDTEPNIKREIQLQGIPMYIGEIGLEPGLNDWGWLWRFANDPAIKNRIFMICQWALMGHEGAIQEVRQNFDIGTGDRVGMVQTYAKNMPGVYWMEYVNTYKKLAQEAYK